MKLPTNILPVTIIPPLLVIMIVLHVASPTVAQQVLVPSGSFHSVLPEVKGEPVSVDSFYLDVTAVTNEEFAEFIKDNRQWRRRMVPSIFANEGYLEHWNDNVPDYETTGPHRPVTRVSWYAANEFCQWSGGRLPTLNEWEYSAQLMDFNSTEEMNRFSNRLIEWYSGVDTKNTAAVGSTGIENRYGIKDQFGLIMEWVEDYKPVVADDLSLDCGTVGRMQQLGNAYSYAASVRYITRMSFNPKSTTAMMGFRCAYDMENYNRL